MRRILRFALLVIACSLAAEAQPAIQSPYVSSYKLVTVGKAPYEIGALAFLNGTTLLIGDCAEGCSNGVIYKMTTIRGKDGHIKGFRKPVSYATGAEGLDAGLAFGPGGVLFARSYTNEIYEFKPGSHKPNLSANLTTYGYPNQEFGTLQFVPPGFPGAGTLKMPTFGGSWYDITLKQDKMGTYKLAGVVGPNVTENSWPSGIFYVPAGSPQFASPTVLVNQGYTGPIWAYAVDADGNPTRSGAAFVGGNFYPYGAAFDPLMGDLLFTDDSTANIDAVQGFSSGTLNAAAGSGQSAAVSTAFTSPLTVLVSDPYGSPVSGVELTFSAPSTGASATLSANTVTTGADGTASVMATANAASGSYSVTATAYSFSASFSLTNTP
jgi:hypothetical protein